MHDVTAHTALDWMMRFVESGIPHQVVTPSSLVLELATRDPDFKKILNSAALSLPDGAGLLWASRFLGARLQARTTGVDLIIPLARELAARNRSVFLLGGAPGVAEQAAARIKQCVESLEIKGMHHGYFQDDPQEEEKLISELLTTRQPDVLMVAMGVPQQEKWIAANLRRLGVPLCIGVGGSFDVLAGNVARSPALFRKIGLEWLYRALREPHRFIRLARLPRFVALVLRERLSRDRE